MTRLSSLLLGVLMVAGPLAAQDTERLRTAKALVFDRKYVEARGAWQQILSEGGAEATVAAFWVARCSENLKEDARAFKEYETFLAGRPEDRALIEEARTSRVGLAARLVKAGNPQPLSVLKEALADPSRTVRYYAAFQVGALGGETARAAVPALKKIVAEEKDPDLVDRARILLLRVDPQALANSKPVVAAGVRGGGAWLKVRIFEKGSQSTKVSINVPVSLAEIVFKSLPEEVKKELSLKGYEAENFWDRLKSLPKMEILTIEGDDGETVQIWIE
jgi:hypothetical protein